MDKIRLCSLLLFVVLSMPAFADDISISNKTPGGPGYGGVGYSVQQTADGGYIIGGTKYSYEPEYLSQMVRLIKTDANGNKVWDRIFGGSHNDIGYSVQQTRNGGYILTGSTESFGAGGKDLWLIKTDANGNEIWNRTFGGARDDWGRSVQQTTDGGYIITGSMYSYNSAHLSQMVWLLKTDANGNQVWDKIFGGPRDDWGYSVQQTNDGGYIITGGTKSFGENGNSALWLIKTNAKGNEIWDRIFGGPGDNVGFSVQQTNDRGYIILGSKESYVPGINVIWLIKTDANGAKVWDKTFSGSVDNVGKSVQQTSDGGYIITGSKESSGGGSQDLWLIKTDGYGNEIWDKSFDGSGWNEGKSVQQTNDGGYIISGSAYSYSSGGKNSVVWLIKTDPNGVKVWDKTFS
ncbi:MAG: hypothetical protein ABR985_01120 [Methanotrichaceae archaeon]